jgi:hypothetical protein
MQVRQTSRVALAALALAVFGLVLGGLVAPATAASSTGKVKGVVSTSGKPIERAKVQIYRTITDVRSGEELAKATRLKTDNTDSKGRFSFSKVTVKAGYSYTLLVTDRTGNTVKTFRTFAPKKNKTITTNVRMEAAAVLRGTVNTVDGRSPAGLTVSVEPGAYPDQDHADDLFHPAWSTTVKADGTYVLKIPANNYDGVLVSDGRYAVQCIDFAAGSLADCGTDRAAFERQRVRLAIGERRTLPTVTVSTFAPPVTKISGKVTDTSGKALKGIGVRITAGGAETTGTTRSSGRFNIRESIPAGSYTVRFDDPNAVWASQYLGGGSDKSVRRQITVTPGQPVEGLNTKLKSISTAKIATKAGSGSAKVAFKIKRKASGSAPSGTLTLSADGVTKTVVVTKGRATVTLMGLPKGVRSLVADYSGTSTTAGFSKIVKVTVK